MKNETSFLELLKESVEVIRESRPYRGGLRPQLAALVRRELMSSVPKNFNQHGLNQMDTIFVRIVLIEHDVCADLIIQFPRFWSDSYEDAIRAQIRLEKSLFDGSLSKFVERDGRDRLKIKSDEIRGLFELLVPGADYITAGSHKNTGKLMKASSGRWSIGGSAEVTSGDVIEVQVGGQWLRTRIESNQNGYYAAVPGIEMYEGMGARQ